MIAQNLAPIFSPKLILAPKPIRSKIDINPIPYIETVRKLAGNDASYTVYRSIKDAKALHTNRTGLAIVTDGPNKGIYSAQLEFITKW